MESPSRHSAGRRFLRTFVFALVQAGILGTLLGALVSFRPARSARDEFGDRLPLHYWLREELEAYERNTFDWRSRALGRVSERKDEVVLVTIDEETLARARRSDQPGLAMEPWPREIVGGLVDQLLSEGAALVATDLSLGSASPRAAGAVELERLGELASESPPRPSRGRFGAGADDEIFRSILDLRPGTSVLGFSWGASDVTLGSELRPFLVLVGERPGREDARELVQRVVAARLPAFVIPGEGERLQVWAGVASEEEGRAFARSLGLRQTATVRDLSPRDQQHQVGPEELFVELAELRVEGLQASRLPQIRFLEPPIAALVGPKSSYGALTLSPDPDGVVRGIQHLVTYRDPRDGSLHVLPSLPLAVAMTKAGVDEVRYADGVLHVGPHSIPMDESGYSLLRWDSDELGTSGRGTGKRGVRAWQVLVNFADKVRGVPEHFRHDLAGTVALVTRSAGAELSPTPIGEAVRGAVLAQATTNLLGSDGIVRAPPRVDFWLTVGLAFVGAFLALSFGGAFRSFGGVILYLSSLAVATAAYSLLARHLFVERQLWVAVAGPLFAMGISFFVATVKAVRTEQEVKEFINGVLGRYVSPEVVRQVMKNVAQMRPERREITAFFSDVEGFTRFSEKLPPDELVQLLNEYLTEITQVVRKNRGHLDKYMGDVVSAFWGGLPRVERHAQHACEAALQIREALARRLPEWEKRFGFRIAVRIGLNSGEAVIGDMGSDLKSNYTVMGDAVDLAARLEGQNKQYGTYLLAGERTQQLAQGEYVFREVDRIQVKDGAIPVKIFELVGRAREMSAERSAWLTAFDVALSAYHAQRFDDAGRLFTRCAHDFEDPVAAVYVKRCEVLAANNPAEGWDGVFRATA